MKTPEQILAEACKTIAHIHNRPGMYIGSPNRTNAGDMFDGMMWVAHWFWAAIQSREDEFRDVVAAVRKSKDCSCQGFADAYRRHHPESDEEAVFLQVQSCWAEIDAILQIDISPEAARV